MRWLAVRVLGAPLRRFHPAQPADAVIVLGTPPDGDRLSVVGEERLAAGVAVFRAGLAPLLVLAGGRAPGQDHARSEAAVMADRAEALGVPRVALLLEEDSTSTFGNAVACAKLLLPSRRRVWIVSQPFHTRRALRAFRRAGFQSLGWRIERSLEERDPRWGLRRVLREYVSWMKALAKGR